jgi:uncharacterized SAM-binding protein YcdF (DUF218 family)
VLAYWVAAFFFLLFCVGVLRDRRRFGNAVNLGIAAVFGTAGLIVQLGEVSGRLRDAAALAVLLVLAAATLTAACFLVLNGWRTVRKEGLRPANMLSLLAGLGIFALVAFLVYSWVSGSRVLLVIAGTTALAAGYLFFLFVCFLGYAFLYGRMSVRRKVDFVVVLGSGLIGGDRVPPLLAARLDRARKVYTKREARGHPPVIVTSGGQGSDEKLPEAHAMADYLVERGVPADRIRCEDQSVTTEDNLRFSGKLMEAEKPGYRCVIVTNNFHVFRAAVTARRTGVNGHVVGAPTATYFWPGAMIREFIALVVDYKRTNLAVCLMLVFVGVAVGWDPLHYA